jgi:hypothetical protein
MSKENEIQFSTENLPFLLHYERYSLGWDSCHEGFFIDPQGNVYSYEKPYYWNSFISPEQNGDEFFWGYETDGQISPQKSFENLKKSKKLNSDLGPIALYLGHIELNMDEVFADLAKSEIDEFGAGCDMGVKSFAVLIFDKTVDLYKRIILKTSGDRSCENLSNFTPELIRYFDFKVV